MIFKNANLINRKTKRNRSITTNNLTEDLGSDFNKEQVSSMNLTKPTNFLKKNSKPLTLLFVLLLILLVYFFCPIFNCSSQKPRAKNYQVTDFKYENLFGNDLPDTLNDLENQIEEEKEKEGEKTNNNNSQRLDLDLKETISQNDHENSQQESETPNILIIIDEPLLSKNNNGLVEIKPLIEKLISFHCEVYLAIYTESSSNPTMRKYNNFNGEYFNSFETIENCPSKIDSCNNPNLVIIKFNNNLNYLNWVNDWVNSLDQNNNLLSQHFEDKSGYNKPNVIGYVPNLNINKKRNKNHNKNKFQIFSNQNELLNYQQLLTFLRKCDSIILNSKFDLNYILKDLPQMKGNSYLLQSDIVNVHESNKANVEISGILIENKNLESVSEIRSFLNNQLIEDFKKNNKQIYIIGQICQKLNDLKRHRNIKCSEKLNRKESIDIQKKKLIVVELFSNKFTRIKKMKLELMSYSYPFLFSKSSAEIYNINSNEINICSDKSYKCFVKKINEIINSNELNSQISNLSQFYFQKNFKNFQSEKQIFKLLINNLHNNSNNNPYNKNNNNPNDKNNNNPNNKNNNDLNNIVNNNINNFYLIQNKEKINKYYNRKYNFVDNNYYNNKLKILQRENYQKEISGILSDVEFQKYLKKNEKLFIAMNLINVEHSWYLFEREILKLIKILGTNNIFVSILSNGNKDKTPELLTKFANELTVLKVPHYIDLKGEGIERKDYFKDRIKYLAELRNRVLEPLTIEYAKVLFINDVILKVQDILKLLLTPIDYDMVCSMDFSHAKFTYDDSHTVRHIYPPSLKFYDLWVARDLDGDLFQSTYPWIKDPDRVHLLKNGLPFQVYSCWNGMVIFKSEPLLIEKIKFRSRYKEECLSSECEFFTKDLWKNGYTKIFINPIIQVAYEKEIYQKLIKSEYYLNFSASLLPSHQKQLLKEIQPKVQITTKTPSYKICCNLYGRECEADWKRCSFITNYNQLHIGFFGTFYSNNKLTRQNRDLSNYFLLPKLISQYENQQQEKLGQEDHQKQEQEQVQEGDEEGEEEKEKEQNGVGYGNSNEIFDEGVVKIQDKSKLDLKLLKSDLQEEIKFQFKAFPIDNYYEFNFPFQDELDIQLLNNFNFYNHNDTNKNMDTSKDKAKNNEIFMNNYKQLDIGIFSDFPPKFDNGFINTSKIKIFWLKWEFPTLTKNWIKELNKFDQIWIPDKRLLKHWKKEGLLIEKCKVVTDIIPQTFFNYQKYNKLTLSKPKKVKLLFFDHLSYQSGFDVLFDTFRNNFLNNETISLTIASKTINPQLIPFLKKHLLDQNNNNNQILNIKLIKNAQYLTVDERINLYKEHDFLISPYRAKTDQQNLIEAQLVGLPIIITDSGISESFAFTDNAYLIPSSFVKCNFGPCHDFSICLDYNKCFKTLSNPFWFNISEQNLGNTISTAISNFKKTKNIILKAQKDTHLTYQIPIIHKILNQFVNSQLIEVYQQNRVDEYLKN
ncbi:hypothetical protein M0812_03655 [Anaeramoeba flamelloides]|uniref:Glycosyl transferase family 1 domain-containing protein n=1 Tax=Anaeramoeba flamelloides TaxID=1746091 RepID=A0AAV8AGF6_9EUKA|nr:hypothetical protein M0812_03655 [Anaeramoeba flamelloides]